MDIAEIRKKAKAQEQTCERATVAEPEVAIDESTACVEPAPVDDPLAGGAVSVAEQLSPVPDTFEESLDRLFADVDDLSLTASSGTSSEALDSRSVVVGNTERQYLAFHLGSEEYALDISHISEIIKVREFTDIPRAPVYLLGIISLRGVVVPVFDLRRRFNLGSSEMLATSRIVVSRHEDVTVGLLVDSINQVIKLSDEGIEPPPAVLSGLDRDLVSGVGRYQGRMLILLNLQSVLAVDSA